MRRGVARSIWRGRAALLLIRAHAHTPLVSLLTLAGTHTQVYLSRIPPFMKPVKVRHLLERHAEVGRIYLAPEGALT